MTYTEILALTELSKKGVRAMKTCANCAYSKRGEYKWDEFPLYCDSRRTHVRVDDYCGYYLSYSDAAKQIDENKRKAQAALEDSQSRSRQQSYRQNASSSSSRSYSSSSSRGSSTTSSDEGNGLIVLLVAIVVIITLAFTLLQRIFGFLYDNQLWVLLVLGLANIVALIIYSVRNRCSEIIPCIAFDIAQMVACAFALSCFLGLVHGHMAYSRGIEDMIGKILFAIFIGFGGLIAIIGLKIWGIIIWHNFIDDGAFETAKMVGLGVLVTALLAGGGTAMFMLNYDAANSIADLHFSARRVVNYFDYAYFGGPLLLGSGDYRYAEISGPVGDEIRVVVNGNWISSDQSPIIQNDRVLIPIWMIAEAMGLSVSWDGETKTVTLNKGELYAEMTIGNATINANGRQVNTDVAPTIIDDRTFVPGRALSEAFNAEITWNGSSRIVYIITK
jgi:hypothetical protein